MIVKRAPNKREGRRSIFRSLFIPLLLIMALQAMVFYFAAVYGGIEESLNQNAADILSERLVNRKNELETRFNNKWADLEDCVLALRDTYQDYEKRLGKWPLARDAKQQIHFLGDAADLLIQTLRHNEVNGIFLILNDQTERQAFSADGTEQKYGLCIRDMDQESNYSGREDLLLERAPASLVDALGCSLDSWWEPKYTFASRAEGDFYYEPLEAAWENRGASGGDLAYCSGVHQISGSDPAMISYSIPLLTADGYPYGVIGIELSTRWIASLLPNRELNQADKCCYVLTLRNAGTTDYLPLVGTGVLYNRCFGDGAVISSAKATETGGFSILGRGNVRLYGEAASLNIYNSNNPFEDRQLTLLALVESKTLFVYIDRVKVTLLMVSLISLVIGLAGLALVSRRFAAPITALAGRVRGMKSQTDFRLDRLGITEIDQLVDSIEELNRNVSKNSARSEFFSRMSHDMRTPMNAIISFSSPMLLEDADEATKDDYLEKIHASGEFLLTLINEVLDMTKIENNKTELHLEVVRADRLCGAVIPIIEKLAQKNGVLFSWETTADARESVWVDTQHLNQIVMNLLSNAVKFTPREGSVQLSVALEPDEKPQYARCVIVVADSGIGMSENFLRKLYTPFEQEHTAQEGTGLGLSIAKKLVELMEGSIECVSRQNVGTTFRVSIPLRKGEAMEDKEAPARQPENNQWTGLRGKRVLVCEDNAINTQIIDHLLSKVGIDVICAQDGQAGVDAFVASAPGELDAILMDIRMPVLDGLAAARTIRGLKRRDAVTIPIIAMTANAFEEDAQASVSAGMNAHLAKPVEPQKLFDTLVALIDEQKQEMRAQ